MIQDLKKVYDEWNNKHLKLTQDENFIEITTPFVDMHHDYIQLFFTQESGNSFKITDDGYILNELSMLGVDVFTTEKRKSFFYTTLRVFGVSFDKEYQELYVSFDSIEEYPKRQHNLIQCMLKISDILFTARNSVISIFTEEVTTYFEKYDVIYTPEFGIVGKSGNQQNFDFVIPKRKNKKEKLIKAVNTPATDNFRGTVFSFIDVVDVRPESEYFVIANDLNTGISDGFANPLKNYNVEVLAWSKRKEWINTLKVI